MRRCLPWGALLGAVACGLARAEDWPQLGGGPDRRGQAQERAAPGAAVLWTAEAGEPVIAGAVVLDGVVVLAAADGTVRGYAEDTGALLWTRELGGSDLAATPAAGRGRVVVARGDGRHVALAVGTGDVVWERELRGGPRAALAVADGALLASGGFPADRLHALDLVGGGARWSAALPQVAYSAPAAAGGLVVVGANDGVYRAFAAAEGAEVWSYATGGRVLLGGAALAGGRAWLLPGGADPLLHVVLLDPRRWAENAGADLSDPAPPGPSWARLRSVIAAGTPAVSDTCVAALVRYDDTLDEAAPWFVADRHVARERLWVLDAGPAPRVRWSAELGVYDGAGLAGVPAYGHCPAPILLASGGGAWVAAASSVEATLRFLRLSDGVQVASLALPGERWAPASSPALANGRLFLVTAGGKLLALQLGANSAPAPAVPALADGAQVEAARVRLAWTPGADGEDPPGALVHEVRLDVDGEVLLDAAETHRLAAGATEVTTGALESDRRYTWRVRTRDPQGALSPWSAPRSLWVALAPAPPAALTAAPGVDHVDLAWEASPSGFVTDYLVRHRRLPAGEWGTPHTAAALEARLTGLEPGVTYAFEVVARSSRGRESAPVSATATPNHPITVAGAPVSTLHEALRRARPGDVVQLGEGTFRVGLPLPLPAGVTLRGVDAHVTRLVGAGFARVVAPAGDDPVDPGAEPVVRVAAGATPARIERVGIAGGTAGVHVARDAELVLRNVLLYDNALGLSLAPGATAEALYLTVTGNTRRGIHVDEASLRLTSSIVTLNHQGVGCAGDPARTEVRTAWNAVLRNHRGRDWVGCHPDPTDHPLEPRFRRIEDRDYRIAPGSPTVDAADPVEAPGEEPAPHGSRANLGAFGTTLQAATSEEEPLAAAAPGSSGGSCALAPPAAGSPPPPGRWWATPLVLLAALGLLRRR